MVAAAQVFSLATSDSDLFDIIKTRSFKEGNFVLSSGIPSTLYFNMKPTMMSPKGAELSARALLKLIHGVNPDYIGGLEMGAVPVIGSIAALSSAEKSPVKTIFVRKEPKKHGTMDLIEGLGPNEDLAGRNVMVVDDVATSGKSIMQAIEAIRAVGGVVTDAACLLNREEGADQYLAEQGVRLHSVFFAHEFVQQQG